MVSFSCTGQHSVMRNVTFASLETPLAPGEPLAAYLEHVYHEPPREPLQWFWWVMVGGASSRRLLVATYGPEGSGLHA